MGYEHLKAYQVAQALRAEVDDLFADISAADRLKFGNELKHVDEAVDSILNNISEGNGSRYPNKRRNFYDIAAGSSREAGNGTRSLSDRGLFTRKRVYRAVGFCLLIPKMLAKLQ